MSRYSIELSQDPDGVRAEMIFDKNGYWTKYEDSTPTKITDENKPELGKVVFLWGLSQWPIVGHRTGANAYRITHGNKLVTGATHWFEIPKRID